MDKLLAIEPGLIIWTFITFGLLLFLLKKYAWKPLIDTLQNREERIRDDLARSSHAKEESERLLEEHRKLMASAEIEARRVVDEARTAAEQARTDILAAAQEQSRLTIERAKAEIAREKDTALAQLRGEIADLAIEAATRVIRESVDDERNRRIVDAFVRDLGAN